MKLFINEDFLVYVLSYYYQAKTGDVNYIPEFDTNKDGIINMRDIGFMARNIDTYYDFV